MHKAGSLLALLALLISASTPTHAGERRVVPEPSLLGIRLGQPLNLPQCPSDAVSDTSGYLPPRYTEIKTLCAMKNAAIRHLGGLIVDAYFPLMKSPRFLKGGQISISTVNDKVWDILIFTYGLDVQGEVLHQLIDKFGKPSAFQIEDLQNGFGVHFHAYFARWLFNDFYVLFNGYNGEITSGKVEIETAKHAIAQKNWIAKQKAAKPKL